MIGKQVLDTLYMFHKLAEVSLLTCIPLLCLVRSLIDGHEAYRDLKYIVALIPVVAWDSRHDILHVAKSTPISWPAVGMLGFGVAVVVVVSRFLTWCLPRNNVPSETSDERSPYLLPARTTHTRFFPKKHSFSYSYLLIAVPIGWEGTVGSFFSVNKASTSQAIEPVQYSTWFSVNASDYLDRGTGHRGLKSKLEHYLRSHGVDPGQYTSSWLVTAPRFLGYSFNPVSYWYLYHGDRLDAMILEVNNTFDERRMYFLTRGSGGDSVDLRDASLEEHKFRGAWPKDFHVSPFNSRKGSYALSALEPSFVDGPWIDNTITLKSSKEHAKLVARNFSTNPAIRVQSMTVPEMTWFVLSWFWVGFMTSPRILREAARLFFQRKLYVWYRPEISSKSIGRNETDRERVIEAVFRNLLRHRAKSNNVAVRYIAAGNAQPHEELIPPATEQNSKEKLVLTVHILTPLFYSHIALVPSIAAYLKHNASGPAEERTFTTSSLEELALLLSTSAEPVHSPLNFHTLDLLRPLRHTTDKKVIEQNNQHELDGFVLAKLRSCQTQYRKVATALVLSHALCPSLPALMDILMFAARIAVLFWSERCVAKLLLATVDARAVPTVAWVGCAYLAVPILSCLWKARSEQSFAMS